MAGPSKTRGLKGTKTPSSFSRVTVLCQSPYNTPILPGGRGGGDQKQMESVVWLRQTIVEAVILIHHIVPNLYTLLSQIPQEAEWLTVLDFKDALFCILLCPDSLCLP